MTHENPSMIDTFKKTLLAGLGAAVVTKDKVQAGLEDFVKQGKITAAEAQSIAEKVAEEGRKEFNHASSKLGDKVRVTCDGCKPMTATITFIAQEQEFTPPVIFSVGNREKLVFKLEARAPEGLPLHPGQPLEVSPL